VSELESAKYWLSWIEAGSSIALLLVAIGVGYEFVANRLERPLRAKLDIAREAEMTQLRKDTAEANARAAEANRKAEEEHVARLKIETQLAPRRLTSFQEEVIIRSLEGYKNAPLKTVCMIDIAVYGNNDSEAFDFARELWSAFGKAGCKSNFVGVKPDRVPIGILVEYDPANVQWLHIAGGIISALRIIGLTVAPQEPMKTIERFDSPVRVVVGRK